MTATLALLGVAAGIIHPTAVLEDPADAVPPADLAWINEAPFQRDLDRLWAWLGVDTVPLPTGAERVRACESGGDYGAVSPTGRYRGAWQFDQPSWDGVVARAGEGEWVGVPPDQAPRGVQDRAMVQLQAERGWQPWPQCGRRA